MRQWVIDQLTRPDRPQRPCRSDFDLNPSLRGRMAKKYDGRPAAVLVPLVDDARGLSVLLTERTHHLDNHAGQVSFPGGSRDAGDPDPVATALREAHEEIGLVTDLVEVVGGLDTYQTSTGFHVTPVVGLVDPAFNPTPDPHEVAEVFRVPLDFFLNPANHRVDSRMWMGAERFFYAMPYDGHYIWGATAAMLVNLYDVLTFDAPINV